MLRYHDNNKNCGLFVNGTLENPLTSEIKLNAYNFDRVLIIACHQPKASGRAAFIPF